MRTRTCRLATAVVAALAGTLFAQPVALAVQLPPAAPPPGGGGGAAPAPGTGTAPAGAVQLEATVSKIKGVVQIRLAEDKPWAAATEGMKVGAGADVRTGLRSAVQLTIEPDQTITLDRLGTVKVLQAFQNQGKVTTDIGMKYGRAQYDIQKTNLEHASTIRSPGSTLALRGTNIVYEDQAPWVPTAVSREGRAEFRNLRRESVAFGGTKRAVVSGDTRGPAQKAIAGTKVDPRTSFSGQTDSEDVLLVGLASNGGIEARAIQSYQEFNRGFDSGRADVAQGTVGVPGPLEFRLDWIQTNPTSILPSDVDLQVTDPQGRTATFQNPVIGTGLAQGMHMGNDLGPRGVGAENVVWGLFFPAGKYTVTAVHQSGADAQIFLTITRGAEGTSVGSFGVDPEPAIVLKAGETFTGTVRVRASDTTVSPAAASAARATPTVARVPAAAPVIAPAPPRFPQSPLGPRQARP